MYLRSMKQQNFFRACLEPTFNCRPNLNLKLVQQGKNIVMHEDYLQIVRDVFSAYTDAEITDTTLKDFLMQVSFTFRGFALKLNIVHPENAYLREVLVCIEDEVAKELMLPPHYMRYDDEKN